MPTYQPTAEQEQARQVFATGAHLVIEAGAGTGKTSTLELLAADALAAGRRGRYLAFNKAIVTEAGQRMPGNVACTTAHGLAFRAYGHQFAHRLQADRVSSTQLARHLGLGPLEVRTDAGRKRLAPGWLASLTVRALGRYCQTADEAPSEAHVPYVDGIDLPTPDGRRGWANNRELRLHLAPAMAKAWADALNPKGQLPYKHDYYLKAWQLTHPKSVADFILFDEAQDANPVMAAIVADQADHAQLVYVGDSAQAIYEFTGAVNAMASLAGERVYLTQSFRFGPAVAEVANRVLSTLDTPLRLEGTPTIGSEVGPVAEPDAILCRTNAVAVRSVLQAQAAGRRAHLVGGGREVVAFAKAALELQAGRPAYHPDLSIFDTWGEVQAYVEQDPQGDELALMVNLVDEFGADVIVAAMDGTTPESQADVIVSTAHKAKGRQWPRVQLAGDFKVDKDAPDAVAGEAAERRLLYVAVTRAQLELDAEAVPWVLNPDVGAGTAGPVLVDLADVDLAARQLAKAGGIAVDQAEAILREAAGDLLEEAPPSSSSVGRACCLHGDQRHGPNVCCLHLPSRGGCP